MSKAKRTRLKKQTNVKPVGKRRTQPKSRQQVNAKRRSKLKAPKPGGRRRKTTTRKPASIQIPSGAEFDFAFKLLRQGRTQKRAAEIAGISARRLRRYLRGNKLAHFRKGQWRINDRRIRSVQIFADGELRSLKVRGFKSASVAMKHRAAVRRFLESNDENELAPFRAISIPDISRKRHLLETRPNVLYRIANIDGDSEMKIYRLID